MFKAIKFSRYYKLVTVAFILWVIASASLPTSYFLQSQVAFQVGLVSFSLMALILVSLVIWLVVNTVKTAIKEWKVEQEKG